MIAILYETARSLNSPVVVREKTFKDEAAMLRWVERAEKANASFLRVVAYEVKK